MNKIFLGLNDCFLLENLDGLELYNLLEFLSIKNCPSFCNFPPIMHLRSLLKSKNVIFCLYVILQAT
jgi:hypothetical protein